MPVQVNLIDTPVGSGLVAQSGVWYVVGQTERGPSTAPITIRSLSQYVQKCGNRVSYGFLYDAAEAFFGEGGAVMVIGRVVGPAALQANHVFLDGAAGNSLNIKAQGPGAYANAGGAAAITVQITHPTTGYALLVFINGVLTEQSPELFTTTDGVQWSSTTSQWIQVIDGGSGVIPAIIAATALTGGTDDRTNIVTGNYTTALNLFNIDLGCGQVSAPGITTLAVQQALLDHGDAFNRTPVVDLADSATAATVASTVASLTGNGRNRAALFAPWAVIPGLTATTFRTVPYSCIQAGIIARNDGFGNPPNVDTAASDSNGLSLYAIGLSQNYTATDRTTLYNALINPVNIDQGNVQAQGNQTLANFNTKPAWIQITAARTFMFVVDAGRTIAKRFVRKTLDPKGILIGQFQSALQAEIVQPLFDAGGLFNDPSEAVDMSGNNTTTAAAKQLIADIAVQPSPAVDTVILNVHAEVIS